MSLELIPKLTGRPPPGPVEQSIFALPARLGGLSICDLIQRSAQDFEDSVKICRPIVDKIISGEYVYDYQCEFDQIKEKQAVVQDRRKKEKRVYGQ